MRHIHYIDSPDDQHRLAIELDSVMAPGMPYGAIEWVYHPSSTEADFVSNRLEEIQPFVRNDLLVIQDVYEAGTILTIAPRADHVLKDIVLDEVHTLVELVNESGMLYWIQIGRSGAFSMKAKVAKDGDGRDNKIAKLRTNLKDIPVREYLADRAKVKLQPDPVREEDYLPVMDLTMAARYLSIAEQTLYKIDKKLLPRTAQGRFRKKDLDAYLEMTMKRE